MQMNFEAFARHIDEAEACARVDPAQAAVHAELAKAVAILAQAQVAAHVELEKAKAMTAQAEAMNLHAKALLELTGVFRRKSF